MHLMRWLPERNLVKVLFHSLLPLFFKKMERKISNQKSIESTMETILTNYTLFDRIDGPTKATFSYLNVLKDKT